MKYERVLRSLTRSKAATPEILDDLVRAFEVEERPAERIRKVKHLVVELEDRLVLEPDRPESLETLRALAKIARALDVTCPEVAELLVQKEKEEEDRRRREEEEEVRLQQDDVRPSMQSRPRSPVPVISMELMERLRGRQDLMSYASSNPAVMAEWNMTARIDAMRMRAAGGFGANPYAAIHNPHAGFGGWGRGWF